MKKQELPYWKNLSLEPIVDLIDGVNITESWVDVIGWEGFYQVSSFGRVKSLGRTVERGIKGDLRINEKILKQNNLQTGSYCAVKLCRNAKHYNTRVHVLVALNFIKNPDPKVKIQVNHIKGIKTLNTIWDLEWVTASENILHSFAKGIHKVKKEFIQKGANNPKSKPVEQYTKDGVYVRTFAGQGEAARITGIDQSMIWHCCNGKRPTGGGFRWKYPKGYDVGKKGAEKGSLNYYQK